MDFDKRKQRELLKYQEIVSAGLVDGKIIKLNEAINSVPDIFTTSSCAGRVIVIAKEDVRSKYSTNFHYKTHDPEHLGKMSKQEFMFEQQLWLLLEPPNLHVMAKTPQSAKKLQKLALQAKLGLSKFQSINPHLIVEILGTAKMQLPLGNSGKMLVSSDYLEFVAQQCKKLLEKDQQSLVDLEELVLGTFEG